MKLHQLQALVAIADAGGVRAAARQLGISQAAVTKALRELEAEQNLPLAVRATSGISFTDCGKALLTHARLIVGQLTRAETELAQFRGAGTVRLCVGVTPWVFMTGLLHRTLTSFRQKMPQVEVEVFEGLMGISQAHLRDGHMDLAISPLMHGLASPEFTSDALLTYQMRVAVWRGHPKAACTTIHGLLDCDWAVNYAEDGREAFMQNLFWQHGAHIESCRLVRAHSLALLQNLLQSAAMVSFCPLPLLSSPSLLDTMVALPLKEQFDPAQLSIITRRGGTVSRAAQCFIDCLQQVIWEHARSPNKGERAFFNEVELRI